MKWAKKYAAGTIANGMEVLMSDNVYRCYDDLAGMIGELEFDVSLLEMMVMNGKNEKANRYLKEAAAEIRHALSDLSDAEFDICTSSDQINYGIEDDDPEDGEEP